MAAILNLLAAIATAVTAVAGLFKKRQERQDAVNEVKAEILDKEVKASNATAEVLAEHRPDDDGSRRLQRGDF